MASTVASSGGGRKPRVALVEYGAGNVRSVRNALSALGCDAATARTAGEIDRADALIFPGVGSFGSAMHSLRSSGLAEPIRQHVGSGGAFLGVCLGMQLLFDGSAENGGCDGLGLVPGFVEAFPAIDSTGSKVSVPHMGWNTLSISDKSVESGLCSHLHPGSDHVYFVHSYRAQVTDVDQEDWVAATCDYNGSFVAAIEQGDVFACQFHPEKSARKGLELYRRFLVHVGAIRSEYDANNSDDSGASVSPLGDNGGGEQQQRSATDLPDARHAFSASSHDTHIDRYFRTDTATETSTAAATATAAASSSSSSAAYENSHPGLSKRVIACMDVRANDEGDLVVTKGDSYDVRESGDGSDGSVRNLGKPVDLAERYYNEGADEVTFLNITGFRDFPLSDLPMLQLVRRASERIFVPLTVGGGIRDFTDPDGTYHSALDVAAEYFRSGADKVSIGSDAVYAAEEYLMNGRLTGESAIEAISQVYGRQAVVVSIDPRRVYVSDPASVTFKTSFALPEGPNGEQFCWYQCTAKGGREVRDMGAVELAQAVEALGAGEILLNCIDEDGHGNGFDLALINEVSSAVTIPVIASSGAGRAEHFTEVFKRTSASAALAAGIFHRDEVSIGETKAHMADNDVPVRR